MGMDMNQKGHTCVLLGFVRAPDLVSHHASN